MNTKAERVVTLLTRVTLGLCVVTALYWGWLVVGMKHKDAPAAEVSEPATMLRVVAKDSSQDTLFLLGKRHLIYVMSTSCPICTEQKEHVQALFQQFPRDQFVTVSLEPVEKIESYWNGSLPTPLRVSRFTLTSLGVNGTPTLILLDTTGQTEFRVDGSMKDWSIERFRINFSAAAN